MENRNVAIGCGVALVAFALLCGGAVHLAWTTLRFAGEGISRVVREQVEAEQARQDLAAQWRPPSPEGEVEAAVDTLFPPQVAEYMRTAHDDHAALPEFEIDRDGRHAVYEAGENQIEVYLVPMTSQEADDLFARIKELYEADDDPSGFRGWSTIRTSETFARSYIHTKRLQQNYLWFVKGWLLVFRTPQSDDIEPFVHAFLRQSGGRPAEP